MKRLFFLTIIILAGLFLIIRFWENSKDFDNFVLVTVDEKINNNANMDESYALRIGDVADVRSSGSVLSDSDKKNYLILKMRLTPDRAAKLLAPEEKEYPKSLDDTEKAVKKYRVRARKYRIKIETLEFNPSTLADKQPYMNQVFDWWEIVENKLIAN